MRKTIEGGEGGEDLYGRRRTVAAGFGEGIRRSRSDCARAHTSARARGGAPPPTQFAARPPPTGKGGGFTWSPLTCARLGAGRKLHKKAKRFYGFLGPHINSCGRR